IESISQYAKGAVARKVYEVESLQIVDLPMQEWVKEGTAPAFSNFETFLPAQAAPEGITGIKIIFSPYQVAPHAYGMPSIIIPANQFYRYLKPEYKEVFIQDK